MDNQEFVFAPEDVEKNRVISALAYILFFLPLICCPGSPFGKFHANQALMLFIVAWVGNIALRFIPFIGAILNPIFGIVVLIFSIRGLINTLNGQAKELPIIGSYRILK